MLVDLEAAEVVVGVDVVVVVLEEHVPKEGWQPVPQYVEVEPLFFCSLICVKGSGG